MLKRMKVLKIRRDIVQKIKNYIFIILKKNFF